MRTRILITWTLVAATLAAIITITQISTPTGRQPTADPAPTAAATTATADGNEPEAAIPQPTEPATPSQVDFAVDSALIPAQPMAEPLEGTNEPRPVARLRSTGGTESDVVLDELVVAFTADSERDAFLTRWNAVVLETDIDESNGITDHLIRIDPAAAPLDRLAANLVAVEPHHNGTLTASDDGVFALLAIAGEEIAQRQTEVALNWLGANTGVAAGTATEDPALGDTFDFNWISSTRPQKSGIDAAWQLLDKAVGTRVKIMVVDRGFVYNEDLPAETKIRHGEWGRDDSSVCSGGGACPFHGTDVAMAAMARADNGFGTAGPASFVADLIAVRRGDSTWKAFKNIKKVAKEERPDIINMSFGSDVTTFQRMLERKYGRWFRNIRDDLGALSFAAAGNSGIDVDNNDALLVPCELEGVVCVGGMNGGDGMVADGSNYSTKTSGKSVEIYGPMCTYGLADHEVRGDGTAARVCGTSVASPVVAGVAALVKAADPRLGPKEIWQIMKDTAHTRNLGARLGNGHHRSIDAYRAVATALGRPYVAPTITITGPDTSTEFGPHDSYELTATATNFAGLDMPIQWLRDDGSLVNPLPTTEPVLIGGLAPGNHVFHAQVSDVMGNGDRDSVVITIANTPPEVSISSPAANTYRYTVERVVLDGSTRDVDLLQQSLTDAQVAWTVRSQNSGDVVFSGAGHSASIPPSTLGAGDYVVEFSGTDSGGMTVVDTSLLTLLDVPPGESLPTVTMHSPDVGDSHAAGSGTATVHLRASAADTQDGLIDGKRMRWIAEQGETRIVLCAGSDLVDSTGGNGGLATITDCSDVSVQLGIPPEAPDNNRWTITVEAVDSAGLPGRATRVVEIYATVA